MASVASIIPFLSLLGDSDQQSSPALVTLFFDFFGTSYSSELLFPLALSFSTIAVIAAWLRLFNLRLNARLAALIGSDLSSASYKQALYQPYSFHISVNSSTTIDSITTQVNISVVLLNQLLAFFSSSLISFSIGFALFSIDPGLFFSAITAFSLAYVFIALRTRKSLSHKGKLLTLSSRKQLKALQEGFGSIRDILLDNTQALYVSIFQDADMKMRLSNASISFISASPRYILEAIGILFIAFFATAISSSQSLSGTSALLPLMGAFALGSQKLLPALQQVFSTWASLQSRAPALASVLWLLEQPSNFSSHHHHKIRSEIQAPKTIEFHNISYRYPGTDQHILSGINLKIQPGEKIGVFGKTGSGKSTLADIFMGLLQPTSGKLLVNGDDIFDSSDSSSLLSWRSQIAHVPQTIYLSDSSFLENIAFGISSETIDIPKVITSAQQAQLDSYIQSTTSKYDTTIGERGVRLSGGQRQRLGIARALYKHLPVLILDEATSALDVVTESLVMNAVDSLSSNITIFIIAHRLSTLELCDRVVYLKDGVIHRVGPPSSILSQFHDYA
ncbi:ABC transporter ATP-binding protein [Synechococcus sp. Minos11]|uniref:ABC transporter ATP-binding protein n=1 Tax=Synechococcus sp. Minos11 TaxID=221341 RepID=UPI001645AFAA|nr:ABC transporter ATP-binding protein [Synechococcus sp. Minos11]